MGLAVRLSSDFKDFYDDELNSRANLQNLKTDTVGSNLKTLLFSRNIKDRRHRSLDLSFLHSSGLSILGLKPVSDFQLLGYDTKILVYTRPCEHGGNGKLVLDNREAQELYPNMPARIWVKHSETNGITLKCLQIGLRRFRVILWNNTGTSGCLEETGKGLSDLRDKKVVSIDEIPCGHLGISEYPIYSIDYISTDEGLKAIDYNEVENLSSLGFDKVMSSSEVCDEIQKFYDTKFN